MTDKEFTELKDKILHRWRMKEADQNEAIAQLIAECERLRAASQKPAT